MQSGKKVIGINIVIFTGAFIISLGYCFLLHTLGAFGGDSGFYVAQAEEILSNGIMYYRNHIAMPYYWGYPTFLALCMAVLGENWVAVALIQIILSAVSMVFLYHIVGDILDNTVLAILLTLFYKVILDTSMWDGRILSDSLGMTLECMTLYFFYLGMRDRKRRDYALFIVFAVWFFLTRTNSISLLLVLFGTLFLRLPKRQKCIWGGIIGIALILAVMGLSVAGRDEVFGLGARVDYYRDYYLQGCIVSGRPEYDYQVPAGHADSPLFLWDIVLMTGLKAVYYWSIYFRGYSTVHIVICFVTILPIFMLTLFSVVQIIRDKKRQLYPFVAGIVSYSFIQVCTEVDFDQRYRAPIFLLCIICSTYGMQKIQVNKRKSQYRDWSIETLI